MRTEDGAGNFYGCTISHLGRFQLGATVPLYLPCKNSSGALAVPDSPPQWKVFSGTTLVEAHLMPIEDRYVVTGLFRATLFLGRLYSTGQYNLVYYYKSSGYYGLETDTFEIVGGGDARGAVISTYFYDRPEARYVVQGLESGSIIKGRNPTV